MPFLHKNKHEYEFKQFVIVLKDGKAIWLNCPDRKKKIRANESSINN